MLLRVTDLKTHFFTTRGVVRGVDGVSFTLERGEVLGLAGESGCGKSTLGYSLIRLVPPPGRIVGGDIELDGVNLTSMNENAFRREIRWKRISMIFQGAMNALNPVYSIGYQMMEPFKYHTDLPEDEAKERIAKHLELVGLDPEITARYPHELSGGMKQRVMIAMALLLEPDLVIADEPTTALDVIVQAQIINLLKKLKKELGLSLIFITHDLSILAEISDKIAVMYAGKIVELGDSDRIYENPRHPYTQKLLAAIPRVHEKVEKLEFIPGAPPNLANPPPGCRFHPRCPYATKICMEKEPEREVLEDGRVIYCHNIPG